MSTFNREEVLADIRQRASSDPEFRALLFSDPAAAVSAVIGRDIPEAVAFTVHEESPTDIHLVIPVGEDLSETDLELVSGGITWGCQGCGCIA